MLKIINERGDIQLTPLIYKGSSATTISIRMTNKLDNLEKWLNPKKHNSTQTES